MSPVERLNGLLVEKRDKILIVTFNRPEKMNAYNLDVMNLLEGVWKDFQADDNQWVAIITGAGNKAFCAGRDLTDKKFNPKMHRPAYSPAGIVWKPIIAALNGIAMGGGFRFAHDCDIRLAAEHAEFGVGETRWNLPVPWACDLARQMPMGMAMELALWGDTRITAQRAYEIGWVNRVVPGEKLMEEAIRWAERILLIGPRAVSVTKQIIWRGAYLPHSEGTALGTALARQLDGMEDTAEGIRAFVEKRKPVFKNR